MGDETKDSRFSHIAKDPRFKTIPRSQRQVKIDKRFQSMFNDKRFKIKYTVDKRGRPISKTSNEDLERYYALSSDTSDSEIEDTLEKAGPSGAARSIKKGTKAKKKTLQSKSKDINEVQSETSNDEDDDDSAAEIQQNDVSGDDGDEARSDDGQLNDNIKSKLRDLSVDYARGEGAIMSDSSSDEESSEDEDDASVEHGWGELDKDAERTDEITSRLAVCNMDWDRIRAVDLMVLLNSFTPPGGLVRHVTIYPSEFGLERMKKEDVEGPPELVEQNSKHNLRGRGLNGNEIKTNDENGQGGDDGDDSSSDKGLLVEEAEEGSSYHREKLRQYQLNRLKYFYAVVECDSANTANHIYTECDGMEYESSATRLDLRFIPDDTTFDQEPREKCSEMPDTTKYRPRNFCNTALQQVKVDLTWDETDPTRTEISKRLMAGESVDDSDLQVYLASSSGGEDSEKERDEGKKNNGHRNKSKAEEGSSAGSDSDDENNIKDPIAKYRSLLNELEEEEEKNKNKDVHMEISWGLGVKEKAEEAIKKRMAKSEDLTPFQQMMEKRKEKRIEKRKQKIKEKEQNSDDDDLISDDDIPSDIDLNDPYFTEEFKDVKSKSKKKKGKKRQEDGETEEDQHKKAELELLLLDKDERKHFNFKKIQEEESGNQSKRNKKKLKRRGKESSQKEIAEDNFTIDVEDNRFSALYSSHLYNIDPTDSHFRKSHAMDALISAKQKRLANSNNQTTDHLPSPPPHKMLKKDAELSRLVKSVKNKAQRLKNK